MNQLKELLRKKILNFLGLKLVNAQVSNNRSRLLELEKIIRERTEVDVEVSNVRHSPHTIILTGRYKDRDYVEVYPVLTEDFVELVELLRRMQRHAKINKVDTGPYNPQIRRIIDEELDL